MISARLLAPAAAVVALAAGAGPAAAAPPPFAERFTFHRAPGPLPEGARTEEWPRFLGPHDRPESGETMLLRPFPDPAPALVWELASDEGYTCPAIVGGRAVFFHRLGNEEVADCFHPETGEHYWTVHYPVDYRDRYGYSGGPRASPVIDGGHVYLYGVTGQLRCLTLEDGATVWERDFAAGYGTPQNYFGAGPTPVVWNDLLIQNAGGREPPENGACVVALDKATGEERWVYRDAWGASYASPVVAELHGRPALLVFAGGESNPPSGGLLTLDPATGKLYDRFPWRADKRESVNASTPVVAGPNRIFISETYSLGGVLLEFDESLGSRVVWKAPDAGNHWVTPVVEDGYLYSFTGRNEPDAELACYRLADGEKVWSERTAWQTELFGRPYTLSFFRGSLLGADGAFLALGEFGTLAWVDLSPEGFKILDQAQLFHAQHTWTLPALHRGLLFVSQNTKDLVDDTEPRLLCYDLRGGR